MARRRVLPKICVRRQQNPRRAKAALQSVLVAKDLLQRVERVTGSRQPFNRHHAPALRLYGQHEAAPDGKAVEQHGAGAADAVLAAEMSAREVEVVAEEVGERGPGLGRALHRRAIHGQTDGPFHAPLPERSSAAPRVRSASTAATRRR